MKSISLIILWFVTTAIHAQSVSGHLSLLANQSIKLEGFNGLKTYAISEAKCDSMGNFTLNYTKEDHGMGYLLSADNKPFIVILNSEDIVIKGEALSITESIKVIQGKENQSFEKYAKEHPKREQALSAWQYLEKMYTAEDLFKINKKSLTSIQKEKKRIKDEDAKFLVSLPKDSYVSWFLPMRKLVSSVSTVAQYRPEEIPSTLQKLRAINYADPRLYKSGLYKDAIDNHVWFVENSSGPIDTMFLIMNKSIDFMLASLVSDEKKYNEVTDHLFNLLEKRSLFTSSEHLALKVLQDNSCTLNDTLSKQLETYRIMKKGNIAPDIIFSPTTYYPAHTSSQKLSELKSSYTLVVFAAGWCSHCQTEVPKITPLYDKWLKKGVEVVLVSLDEDIREFSKFAAPFPFISTTDLKKWESPTVKDYHVFGTPTMFLLDAQRKILLRPSSVNQVDAWVDWYLGRK
jgi:thiol-disulfide isomerase/thioredoxin